MLPAIAEAWDKTLRSNWATLFILGVAAVGHGLTYLPAAVPSDLRILALEKYLPLWAWAAVWIVEGLMLIGCAVARRAQPLAAGLASLMPLVFGCLFIGAWFTGDSERGYVVGGLYIIIWYLVTGRFAVMDKKVE